MINSTPELNLIKVISQWPKVVQLSAIHLEPHRITFYLINLASEFHSLWNRGKVDQSLKFLHYEDEKNNQIKDSFDSRCNVNIGKWFKDFVY